MFLPEHQTRPIGENEYGILAPTHDRNAAKALVTAGRNSLIVGIHDSEALVGALINLNRFTLADYGTIC